jgi:gamma-glutamyl hercynylcysteine S-oxide synthase
MTFHSSLAAARQQSDALFATLREAAWLERPVAERHRLLFYLGHLEAFDRNLLVPGTASASRFQTLFAFGIDPLDALPQDTAEQWPAIGEVRAWVEETRAEVDAHAAPDAMTALMTLEHRLMHVETLAYLFERLAPSLREVPKPVIGSSLAVPQRWLSIPAGPVQLGLERAQALDAGWCNEYEGHTVDVAPFDIEARKTTHGDWLDFIEAGGYHDARYWAEADWAWVIAHELQAPARWHRRADQWWFEVSGVEVPLPLSWPVYVSQAEAQAYARFRSAALPTEAQWHRAVHGTEAGTTQPFPWGEARPRPGVHGNFGFAHETPTTVGSHPKGQSAFGLDEPIGNGWEWTSTAFAPFPGFAAHPKYPGYSSAFFEGRHFVLAGASHVTAPRLVRRSFRNWYQPHYRAPFATVRLARPQGRHAL